VNHTVRELAAMLRNGEIKAEQLLDQSLERIRRLDPGLNSFVWVDEIGARAAARQSDAHFASHAPRSALEGVPLSIKDNILVKGMPATWGSRSLAGFTPEIDELPVARLRAAGAVIVGKTNVPELTLEGYTKNDLFGVTRNPWDLRLTPSGSSGGAAAFRRRSAPTAAAPYAVPPATRASSAGSRLPGAFHESTASHRS
jgi:aspartyl-tRNA(Asn)/glutamyl-tRNA(Gln) amidotransferase subunit A